MSKQGLRTLVICLFAMLLVYGVGALVVLGAETNCHDNPCITCPEGPPGPPGPPGKKGEKGDKGDPGRGGSGGSACCRIDLIFYLDGEHYHDMTHCDVPRKGDAILFEELEAYVSLVKWATNGKQVHVYCVSGTPIEVSAAKVEQEQRAGCFINSIKYK